MRSTAIHDALEAEPCTTGARFALWFGGARSAVGVGEEGDVVDCTRVSRGWGMAVLLFSLLRPFD